METLIEIGNGPLTVRAARDRLSAVLRAARNGTVQLVGRNPDGTVVVIALANLVDLIDIALRQSQTLGEALDEIGFKPLDRRVIVGQRRKEK